MNLCDYVTSTVATVSKAFGQVTVKLITVFVGQEIHSLLRTIFAESVISIMFLKKKGWNKISSNNIEVSSGFSWLYVIKMPIDLK